MDEMLDRLDVVSSMNCSEHVCQDVTKPPRKVSFRGSLNDIEEYYNIVVLDNPEAKRYCDNCGFSYVFEFDFANGDRGLVEAIAERWWSKTKSFHFREFEIGLIPLDWYMLNGIPTGDPSKQPVLMPSLGSDLTYPALDDLYFSDIKNYGSWDSKKSSLSLEFLRVYMDSRKDQDNTGCAQTLTRAFFMWCFGHFLLAHSTGKVDKRWVLLLAELDRVGEYDWGLASLGNTYKYLDDWSTKGTNLAGILMVLEYWYYYYFCNMQPFLFRSPEGHYDVFPKICLFKKIRIVSKNKGHQGGQKDTIKHSLKSARIQIDTRTRESCILQPWEDSMYSVGDQYEYALNISKKRVMFFDFEKRTKVSCYLAERFQWQIIGEIVVPTNPPSLDQIDDKDIVEVTEFYAVTEDQCNTWWKKKSVGP
ncbi:protein MAIN-LIKE 2-like [Papaver somniferum]|uniref:protein MAIN-LIKE 2-like n=1 Tax=Papaver somniferum TaxID=3469 RepID=UPI000E70026D|nr:protein MAIN-LIKE 2-like [Papaver somniferum]